MKTKTSETEGVKVQFTEAETLAELQAVMEKTEIVKLANDYLNRHHFLPEVRDALRRVANPDPKKEVKGLAWAKSEENQGKQLEGAKATVKLIESGHVFDLYEFTPTRREAKENKTKAAIDAAVALAKNEAKTELAAKKLELIEKLVAGGMSREAAESTAAMF